MLPTETLMARAVRYNAASHLSSVRLIRRRSVATHFKKKHIWTEIRGSFMQVMSS
jgi:hypothetical protein